MTNVVKDSSLPKFINYSLSEAIDALRFGAFQILLAIGLGLALLSDSMEIMVLAVLGPALECTWNISKTSVALITTCVFLGMAISAPLWGYASDRFGRKKVLIVSSSFLFIFGLSASCFTIISSISTVTGVPFSEKNKNLCSVPEASV